MLSAGNGGKKRKKGEKDAVINARREGAASHQNVYSSRGRQ